MSDNSRFPDNKPANATTISGLNLDHLIDLLPCYISVQNRDLRILFINQNFKNDFGDAVGKLCHTVYKGSTQICPNCPVQKTFQDKRIHLTEETVQLANGKISQILIQTSPILDENGDVTAVIEMATNITRVKIDQKELATLDNPSPCYPMVSKTFWKVCRVAPTWLMKASRTQIWSWPERDGKLSAKTFMMLAMLFKMFYIRQKTVR